MMIGEMIVAWLVSGLLFVGLHYFPWSQLLGKCLEAPKTYVAGTLGLGICYSGLLLYWVFCGDARYFVMALIAFWGVVAFGGGAVLLCYALDNLLERKARAKDELAREELESRRGHAQQ